MKVLVMDLTHGGSTLALEYRTRGAEVSAVDCYRTAGEEAKEELERAGIEYLESSPRKHFDLVVMPIHCPDSFLEGASYGRRITTHQAVGELCSFEGRIVEVTGTKGKTSTCHVIAHILSDLGCRVMLLSSRGIFYLGEREEIIKRRSSIAPPSVLKVWRMRRNFDFGVFEVSLGGTGLAEVGVITTIADDYPIAKGTRRAFDGKAQMAVGARRLLVVSEKEKDLWSDLADEGVEIVTFGDGGGIDVKVSPPLIFDEAAELEVYVDGRKELSVEILGSYLVPSYLPAFSAALATAIEAGAELDDAAKALQSFSGIPGRGEVRREGGVWLIRERNPGVTASSVDFNLTCLRDHYDLKRIGVVIEPTTKNVCERLEMEELEKVIMKHQDCVSGAYFLHHCGDKKYEGEVFHLIDDISEAGKDHDALLWCTKEGFQ